MIELPADIRLAVEAIEEERIALEFGVRNLNCDLSAGANVRATKDRGHAAAVNQAIDPVVADPVAGLGSLNHRTC
jgi:hypothetical protein